jgi:predicted nuclease with TOPRIM domain
MSDPMHFSATDIELANRDDLIADLRAELSKLQKEHDGLNQRHGLLLGEYSVLKTRREHLEQLLAKYQPTP